MVAFLATEARVQVIGFVNDAEATTDQTRQAKERGQTYLVDSQCEGLSELSGCLKSEAVPT
jgi:hypothetical protein